MDNKKNFLIGIALVGIAFWVQTSYDSQRKAYEESQLALAEAEQAETFGLESEPGTKFTRSTGTIVPKRLEAVGTNMMEQASSYAKPAVAPVVNTPAEDEAEYILENEFVKIVFSNYGGAAKKMFLKQIKKINTKEKEILEDNMYVMNEGVDVPMLNLQFQNAPEGFGDFKPVYSVVSQSNQSIVFEKVSNGVKVERIYRLPQEGEENSDPYQIFHETIISNIGTAPVLVGKAHFDMGTSLPIVSDELDQFMTMGYNIGEKTTFLRQPEAEFVELAQFKKSSGFLGIGAHEAKDQDKVSGNIIWGSVKNQFFTMVLTPLELAQGVTSRAVELSLRDEDDMPLSGVNGSLDFDVDPIAAGDSRVIAMNYFSGPKEFERLMKLGKNQDLVMEFGFFGFFSKILLQFMRAIHEYIIGNWGWSIVIMTICVKMIFWPLTAQAAKSQKRMQMISKPLQEIKKKFKDNPQKIQKETMKLFKANKVNPAAGCFPIFVQIPIFLGLFWMLRSASELRFADFLWISDLAQPDTVYRLGGFPINIMPLFMGITMVYQMKLTPMPMASADNEMAQMQQKMFRFMPFMFLIFLYNFSSGLVVYWTMQNLLTILQQTLTNRKKDSDLPEVIIPTETKKKKNTKNKRRV